MTSSGPSGPPKETSRNAASVAIAPSNQVGQGAPGDPDRRLVVLGRVSSREGQYLVDIPGGMVVGKDRLAQADLRACRGAIHAQHPGRRRTAVKRLHDIRLARPPEST